MSFCIVEWHVFISGAVIGLVLMTLNFLSVFKTVDPYPMTEVAEFFKVANNEAGILSVAYS